MTKTMFSDSLPVIRDIPRPGKRPRDPLEPDFFDEDHAANDGWAVVTRFFRLPAEREEALVTMAQLQSIEPDPGGWRVSVVGDQEDLDRIAFALTGADLVAMGHPGFPEDEEAS